MLKKLLYLYNDGHNPFPRMGKGGLGYKPQQYRRGIHGEAITFRNVNGVMEVFDDPELDYTGDPDYDADMDARSENINRLLELHYNDPTIVDDPEFQRALREADLPGIDRVIKKINKEEEYDLEDYEPEDTELNKFVEEVKGQKKYEKYKNINVDAQLARIFNLNRSLSLTDENIKKIKEYLSENKHKNIDYLNQSDIERIMKELGIDYDVDQDKLEVIQFNNNIINPMLKDKVNFPNRGIAFEYVMLKNEQTILKNATNTTLKFKDISKNKRFLNDDGTPIIVSVPRGLGKDELRNLTLYDAYNDDCDLEFKYYPNDDVCEVQYGKLTGNPYFIPYFIEVDGDLKLYNIWNSNIDGWVNSKYNKDVYIVAQLDDGKYKFKVNQEKYGNYEVPFITQQRDGVDLLRIDEYQLKKDKFFEKSTKTSGRFNLTKKQMIKI